MCSGLLGDILLPMANMTISSASAKACVDYAASVIVSKSYNGYDITFNKGENLLVNATQMSKPFGKLVGDWLRLRSTDEFINTLSTDMQIPISALIQVVKGGNNEQGSIQFRRVDLPRCGMADVMKT